nr:ABC transporter ATP-binding protein [Candidatus Sigynarchaeota archaeon]
MSVQNGGPVELKWEGLKSMFPFLKRHRKSLIIAIFWTILLSASGIVPPLLLRDIIDIALPRLDFQALLIFGLMVAGVYTFRFFALVKQSRVTAITGQNVIRDIRETLLGKYLGFPMNYYESSKRGVLLSILTGDSNVLGWSITTGIIALVNDMLSLVLIIITIISLNPMLGILFSIIFPSILLLLRHFRALSEKNYLLIRQRSAEITAKIEEHVSGIRVAQSLTAEDRTVQGFKQISQQVHELWTKDSKLYAQMSAIIALNFWLSVVILIGLGGLQYVNGGISIGILIAFSQYMFQLNGPVQDLASLLNTFQEAGATLSHIRESITNVLVIPEPSTPTPLPATIQGEVKLTDVTFSYGREPLFQHLNLVIQPHEKVGIVGDTGAGKTTLINLITRLYDVKDGAVQIDGIDVRNLRSQDLRSLIAIVSQNTFLFADTIFNNIKFGRPTATREEVLEAARLARADKFILCQPSGYDTKLGDTGVGISGGQRQLIAYARLILARPKVAILDEATSNIDSYTENLIQENMNEIMKDSTVLIIAHRFATLQKMHRLILLRNGVIEASGPHAELYRTNAYYRELCEKQYSKL